MDKLNNLITELDPNYTAEDKFHIRPMNPNVDKVVSQFNHPVRLIVSNNVFANFGENNNDINSYTKKSIQYKRMALTKVKYRLAIENLLSAIEKVELAETAEHKAESDELIKEADELEAEANALETPAADGEMVEKVNLKKKLVIVSRKS